MVLRGNLCLPQQRQLQLVTTNSICYLFFPFHTIYFNRVSKLFLIIYIYIYIYIYIFQVTYTGSARFEFFQSYNSSDSSLNLRRNRGTMHDQKNTSVCVKQCLINYLTIYSNEILRRKENRKP